MHFSSSIRSLREHSGISKVAKEAVDEAAKLTGTHM